MICYIVPIFYCTLLFLYLLNTYKYITVNNVVTSKNNTFINKNVVLSVIIYYM